MKKYEGVPVDFKNRANWVAIIGSRNASKEELKMAYLFARKCAERGKIVVSGLAAGVDEAAHKGALDAGGKTIAIVNTPSSQPIYPKSNQALAEAIKKQGGILYPFQTKAMESAKKEFSHFSKRLIERDVLVAFMCPSIVAVSDKEVISGGTRWAVAKGQEMNKTVKRLDSIGKMYDNPLTDKINLFWDMELKLE